MAYNKNTPYNDKGIQRIRKGFPISHVRLCQLEGYASISMA